MYSDKKESERETFFSYKQCFPGSVLPYQKVNDNEDEMLADSVRRCGVHLVFRAR